MLPRDQNRQPRDQNQQHDPLDEQEDPPVGDDLRMAAVSHPFRDERPEQVTPPLENTDFACLTKKRHSPESMACGTMVVNRASWHFTGMCSSSEAGSYLRLVDSCITELKAQQHVRTCNTSQEEEEEQHLGDRAQAQGAACKAFWLARRGVTGLPQDHHRTVGIDLIGSSGRPVSDERVTPVVVRASWRPCSSRGSRAAVPYT